MTLYGLDCSNHQGSMSDLGGYRASFFVHKLTEGTTYTDPDASHNLSMARRHRVPVLGGYHYLRQGNGVGEADYFADRARALFGHDLRGFLWQLDCEADATYRDIATFKQRWDKGTGAPILFYTGDWWLKPRGWNIERLGFAGLWSAPNRGYVGKAGNVRSSDWIAGYGGFDRITILQYDARQSIGDTNEYAGTLAQLKALTRAGKEREVLYTSVNAYNVALDADKPKYIQFTSANANSGHFWSPPHNGGSGYNVCGGGRMFAGDVTVVAHDLPDGATVSYHFVETDPKRKYAVHKSHPWHTTSYPEGHATTVSWMDRGMHLWVQVKASKPMTVTVYCKVGAFTG